MCELCPFECISQGGGEGGGSMKGCTCSTPGMSPPPSHPAVYLSGLLDERECGDDVGYMYIVL